MDDQSNPLGFTIVYSVVVDFQERFISTRSPSQTSIHLVYTHFPVSFFCLCYTAIPFLLALDSALLLYSLILFEAARRLDMFTTLHHYT